MNKKAVIFDLDGTLTDTLLDLALSTNYALRESGMPERTLDEIRQFVGNGVRNLIKRAVPKDTDEEVLEKVFLIFKSHYVVHCQDNTQLYEGIPHLLKQLRENDIRMAIVSNKLQAGVDELYNAWFSDTVEVAIGEHDGVLRKPAPDMVFEALRKLGVHSQEAIYVGDSDVDIETARNAGLPCVSVLWGFRDRDFLVDHGATMFASNPIDIISYLNK